MRIGSIVVAALLALAAGSCGTSEQAARKLRKMDFHAKVDDRGRLQLTFRLFDAKHEQMPITGAYTAEVTKLDGALLCKASGELAPSDFSDKGAHKPRWVDAGCPADPGADEVKLNVKLTVKGGAVDAEAAGKEKARAKPEDEGAAEAKAAVIERSVTVAVRTLYERPPVKPPAAGSGSSAAAAGGNSASGSAAGSNSTSPSAAGSNTQPAGAAGSGTGSGTGSGSAPIPAEKPTAEKSSTENPAPTGPKK